MDLQEIYSVPRLSCSGILYMFRRAQTHLRLGDFLSYRGLPSG